MNVTKVNSNPKEFALTESSENIIQFLKEASNAYYNGEKEVISDTVYDIIYDTFKTREPNNDFFKIIGSEVVEDKVKLPVFMGSQNKVKTKKELMLWLDKNHNENYIITPKYDGSSALLEYKNGCVNLYSRGKGVYGKNLNHLIPFMNLPKIKSKLEDVKLRGELIVSKTNFKKHDEEYAKPRNMVNSLTSNKKINKTKMKHLDFIVFDVYDDDLNLEDRLNLAKEKGFNTALYEIVSYNDIILWNSDKDNYLTNKLNFLRKNYDYDIDGLIITNHKINTMNKSGNPRYSIAFKSNNYGIMTTITDIHWNVSKHGRINPRIQFEPINIGNSKIEYCSGKSGRFIFNNCLNIGSKIRVILSGEIIPEITEIIAQSYYPLMPDIEYKWDKNKVNVFIVKENDDQIIQKIMFFLKAVNIENIGIGVLTKIYNGGFDSIDKILKITSQDLNKLDGFSDVLSNKIVDNISKIVNSQIYLPVLMHASCTFKYGFGVKKFEKIMEKYPDFLENDISYDDLINIPSFNHQSATKFLENLPHFKIFLEQHSYLQYEIKTKIEKNHKDNITDKNFVFTGKRDKDLMEKVQYYDGNIQPAITKKTNYLVVDTLDKKSVKIEKAKELNIDIISKDTLKNMLI